MASFAWSSPRARAVMIGAIALVARAVFVAVAGRNFDVGSMGDHVTYTEFARLMLSGPEWITYPLAVREPLYPAFMALAYVLPGGDFGTLQVFQILAGAVAPVWLYLGLRPHVDERVAVLTGLMLALHPHFVPMAADPLRENLIVPLVVAFVVTFLSAMARGTRWRLFLHALVIVLLAHTDVRFLPLAIVFPVMAWLAHRGVARALRETAWVAGFALVLMIPYQVRGYLAMGQPVIITERVFGRWLPRAGTVSTASRTEDRETWLMAFESRKQAGLDSLSSQERRYFLAGGRPATGRLDVHWFLFKEYWRFAQLGPFYRPYPDGRFAAPWSMSHNVASTLVMVPFFLLVIPLIVLAGTRERRVMFPLLFYLSAHCVMHVLVHVRERYRVPMEVITGLAVAMALVLILDRLTGRTTSGRDRPAVGR